MTPLYQQRLSRFEKPEEKLRQILSKIPLGQRMTRPEEIAAACRFSIPRRSSHITVSILLLAAATFHLDRALT
jgi:L-fucose dehydrogenase